jgi:hypothetical protein
MNKTNSDRAKAISKMDKEEVQIAKYAHTAWKRAKERTLSAGIPVVVGVDGKLIRIDPSGKQTQIGTLPKRIHMGRILKGKAKWKTAYPE